MADSSIGGSWSFAYDKASRRTQITHPSSLKTQYTYNKANCVLGVYTNTSTPAVVESWSYTYDDVGNRLTMTENTGGPVHLSQVYRLKSESYSAVGPSVNHTDDGVGNWLTEKRNGVWTNYTYDADNRITARGTTNYTYDSNGNQATKVAGGVTTTYTWDYENRLTQVAVAGDPITAYETTTDGDRVSRTAGGTKASTIGDGGRFTATMFNDGTGPHQYPSPTVNSITAAVTATHVYATAGTYAVTVAVKDENGGQDITTLSVVR